MTNSSTPNSRPKPVKLRDDLHRRLAQAALDSDTTMQDLLAVAVTRWLNSRAQPDQPTPAYIPGYLEQHLIALEEIRDDYFRLNPLATTQHFAEQLQRSQYFLRILATNPDDPSLQPRQQLLLKLLTLAVEAIDHWPHLRNEKAETQI